MSKQCNSWHFVKWRFVRCSYGAKHVQTSKWHCAATGDIWRVKDSER